MNMIFSTFKAVPKTDNYCWSCGNDILKKVYNKVVYVCKNDESKLINPKESNKKEFSKKIICCNCYRKFPKEYLVKTYDLKSCEEKRYYYHLTENNWGKQIVLSPRINGANRDEEEPEVPRICVSPEIAGCFVSICCSLFDRLNLYRTEKEVIAFRPYKISDSHITKEHWLTEDTKFVLFSKVNKDIFLGKNGEDFGRMPYNFLYGDGSKEGMDWQKRVKKIINRRILSGEYWIL